MSQWLFVTALIISSNLDNVGVSLSYGIRNIRIGAFSNLLIAVICFVFSACGIYAGMWISEILPGILPGLLGSFILIIIGIRLIFLGIPRKGKDPQITQALGEFECNKKVNSPYSIHKDIHSIHRDIHKGIHQDINSPISHNINRPISHDIQQDISNTPSCTLGLLEALLLGIALSANALTNGVGAGLLGFPPLLISLLTAVASFITILVGTACGLKLSKVQIGKFNLGQFGTVISGCLLMVIAVSIFFQ
ncbi:MAG: hypothetical protein FWG14_05110 [Peptococcaceae bacterium]|nr:hypothetical protein [Peptococcaceae bacterium]